MNSFSGNRLLSSQRWHQRNQQIIFYINLYLKDDTTPLYLTNSSQISYSSKWHKIFLSGHFFGSSSSGQDYVHVKILLNVCSFLLLIRLMLVQFLGPAQEPKRVEKNFSYPTQTLKYSVLGSIFTQISELLSIKMLF